MVLLDSCLSVSALDILITTVFVDAKFAFSSLVTDAAVPRDFILCIFRFLPQVKLINGYDCYEDRTTLYNLYNTENDIISFYDSLIMKLCWEIYKGIYYTDSTLT